MFGKILLVIEFIKGTESTLLIPKYLKLAFKQHIKNATLSATLVSQPDKICRLGYHGFDFLPCTSSNIKLNIQKMKINIRYLDMK